MFAKSIMTVLVGLVSSNFAMAADQFKNCTADLKHEEFVTCRDDNGNLDICAGPVTPLGTARVELVVQSKSSASAQLVFQNPNGRVIKSGMQCALTTANGDVNDMECIAEKSVSAELGKMSLSFNSYEAPYYVAIFSESGNAPVGAFSTDTDCN